MSVIRQLKSWFSKQNIYPKTVEHAIYDSEGRRLDNKLESGVSNPNLLINTNFSNPVNQREYDGSAKENEYCIDRWKLLGKLSLLSNCISLTSLQENSYLGYLVQKIEYPNEFKGRTVTLSLKYRTSSENCYMGIHTTTSSGSLRSYFHKLPVTDGAWRVETLTIKCEDEEYAGFEFSVYCGYTLPTLDSWVSFTYGKATVSNSIDIQWAKLEDEDIATPYKRKLFGEELLLCRRYFRYGSTNTQSLYDYPMRVTPTITSISSGKYSYDSEL